MKCPIQDMTDAYYKEMDKEPEEYIPNSAPFRMSAPVDWDKLREEFERLFGPENVTVKKMFPK